MGEKKQDNEMLETTTEIKQGHAGVGKFNMGVFIVLTITCIVYLILNFNP
jgi:hypothetical protein